MVTFKKFKYVIFSLLAIAVIASATAFSVSYAKWAAPTTDSVNANLSTGNWNNKPTSVSDGIMVGDKPYYSFEYSEGSGDNIETFKKCVIRVRKNVPFQIFGEKELLTYGSSNWEISSNKDNNTFTYNGYNSDEAFIEVTVVGKTIISMGIKTYSFASLANADVIGLLKSSTENLLAQGILTSKDRIIAFDGTTINLDEGEQFYVVYDSSVVIPYNMVSDIAEDDWQINSGKTTFAVSNGSNICTMKGKGTIRASIVDGQPNIVISLDDSSIAPTTITRVYDYGEYSYKVIYGN